jgi:hypothetical protein
MFLLMITVYKNQFMLSHDCPFSNTTQFSVHRKGKANLCKPPAATAGHFPEQRPDRSPRTRLRLKRSSLMVAQGNSSANGSLPELSDRFQSLLSSNGTNRRYSIHPP